MYEWDEAKRKANHTKHGIDFSTIYEFEWDSALIESSAYPDECRLKAMGYIGSRLYNVVFTLRGVNIRVISLRKANSRERNRYAKAEAN